ncbi:methyltransferase domain-containing protein [uncultured Parasutterella sp.]|uniref:class I SAM-dependent methyltransferase n=1 Tax=uncultured Parasutterella sp. TaxID=1263098 RepID=UPI0025912F7C|nr:methyltransferase domain-containing protein [uncultured Parasutterella sp.]
MLEYNEEDAFDFTQQIMEPRHDPLFQFWRLDPRPLLHVRNMLDGVNTLYKETTPHKVLDLGCGTGQFLHLLLILHPQAEAVGVNFFKCQINAARQTHGGRLVLKQGDINTYQDTNKYDMIFCNYTLGHIDDLKTVSLLAKNLLTDDGVFVAWDIAPASVTDNCFYGYWLRSPTDVLDGFSDFKGAYAYADGAAPMEGAEQVLSHDAKAFEYYTLPVLYVFWKRRK